MSNQSSAVDVLFSYRAALSETIETVLDDFLDQLPEYSDDSRWAFDTLREYSLRSSKRIRGSLAAYTYDTATGQSFSPEGLRLGAAIEFVQNQLLIVDDMMDRSSIRRGLPSVHELHKTHYNSSQRDSDNTALLVGLLAQYVTNNALIDLELDPKRVLLALKAVQKHVAITDLGQIDDVRQQLKNAPVSLDDMLRRYQQKSSYYSFVDPIECGLILAGRSVESAQIDAERFGIPAGIAFQLRDDYIGIFSSSDDTGKQNLDDIHEGKYTVMVHYALEAGTEKDTKRLTEILGDERAGAAELSEVRDILERTGAVEKAMRDATKYADTASMAARAATSWNEEFAQTLVALVAFSVERNK